MLVKYEAHKDKVKEVFTEYSFMSSTSGSTLVSNSSAGLYCKEVNMKELYSSNINIPRGILEFGTKYWITGVSNLAVGFLIILLIDIFLIFLPISLIPVESLEYVWNSLMACLFSAFILTFVIRLIQLNYYNKGTNTFIEWLFLFIPVLLYFISIALSVFGLIPISRFISNFAKIPIIFILADGFINIAFKYKNYLCKSIILINECFDLFAGGSIFFIIAFIKKFITIQENNIISLITARFVILFEISVVCLMIFVLYKFLSQNEDENKTAQTIVIIFALIAILVTLEYIENGYFRVGLFATLSLIISIIVLSNNFSKKHSMFFAYFSIVVYFIIISINILEIDVTSKYLSANLLTIISTVFAIISNILTIFTFITSYEPRKSNNKFAKYIKNEIKVSKLNYEDIHDSINEILGKLGPGLQAVKYLVKLAQSTKKVSPFLKLIKYMEMSNIIIDKDLLKYLKISVLCMQFAEMKYVFVKKNILHQKNITVRIDRKEEFIEYICSILPKALNRMDIWEEYLKNRYIVLYISKERINKLRPQNLTFRIYAVVKKFALITLIAILASSFVASDIIIITNYIISPQIKKVSQRYKNLILDAKLKYVEAFKPYEIEEYENYYGYEIYDWVIEKYKLMSDGYIEADYQLVVNYLEKIINFKKTKDEIYYGIKRDLGFLYSEYRKYDEANSNLNEAVKFEFPTDKKDDIYTLLAENYIAINEKKRAIALLSPLNSEYKNSKKLLAALYFKEKKYNLVIDILENLSPDNLDVGNQIYLGVAYYDINMLDKAGSVFECIDSSSVENFHDTHASQLYYIYISRFYLMDNINQEVNYFLAAENMFKALLVSSPWDRVANIEFDDFLEEYKYCIDQVKITNEFDYRVNIWYSVYYYHKGDIEKAVEYLKHHLINQHSYEERLVERFIMLLYGNMI